MTKFKYDSITEIENEYLQDLAGLNRFIDDRREAGYSRKERLTGFIILGRWFADECGNFGKIISENGYGVIPALVLRQCPKVILRDEIFKLLPNSIIMNSAFSSDVPPSYTKCVICEQGWNITNAHDCVSESVTEVIDANPFIGAKLTNIINLPQYKNVFPHRVSHECVRPKHLDKGSDRVSNEYLIKQDDKLFATVWRFMHEECSRLKEIKETQQSMRKLFDEAISLAFNDPINFIDSITDMIMMKNQYSQSRKDPWFRVKFKTLSGEHEITIGWRKSVINIEWPKSNKDLSSLFKDENVTKSPSMIHAHGKEKAIEYLTKIIGAL